MDVAWLAGPEGREVVEQLRGTDPLRARGRFPGVAPERLAAALTQARHRPEGFPLPLVTAEGVQQASPVEVAVRRARRVADAHPGTVLDAGCGIGVDSWAMAAAGLHVVAYESDPATAEVAAANLAGRAEVVVADVTRVRLPDGLLYVDPARRLARADPRGRPVRVHDPQRWRPPWSWVVEQSRTRPVVARIRPGHRDLPEGAEWHCTSIRRRLVDATVWFPPLARVPRRASVFDGDAWHELTGPAETAPIGAARAYILDPDPAIVRSGLVADAAHMLGGALLDEHLAFVTTDREPPRWMGRSMRVLEQTGVRAAAGTCRRLGLPTANVWARGFDRTPALDLPQGPDGVVVMARLGPQRHTRAWVGTPTG